MSLKRPASSSSSQVAKKPAASKESINSSVKAMRKGLAEDDKFKGQEDAELQDQDQLRDKSKAEKFARMRQAGQLPAYIVTLFEEESKVSAQGARKFKTDIINKMFVKGRDGTWQLDVSDSVFSDYKAVYESKFSKDKTEAMPKSLVIGMYFAGDEMKFNKALADGEIELVKEDNGVRYYGYKKFQTGTVKGTESRLSTTGQKKLSADEHHSLGEIFEKLNWTWKGSKANDQKQLDKGKLPANMEDLLKKAAGACEKLSKDALKLQATCPAEKRAGLKNGYKEMSQALKELDHMKNFLELGDGTKLNGPVFESAIGEIASQVDKFNMKIEECKGAMKALKN